MQKPLAAFTALVALFCIQCTSQQVIAEPKDEVIYHVVQRSFYDSNGDLHGDLKGLQSKLDYLQDLGVTSILLLPLYESVYYHNYFPIDFEKIDPEFGSMQDYIELVEEIHRRGMKIYLDMEIQYVTEDHVWWKDSYGNLQSKYKDYILYQDSAHTKPSTIIFNLTELKGFNGTTRKITTVNLNSKNVFDYNLKLFSYFIDPDKDGNFSDGADGFRLDHMMDTLDKKPELKDLFKNFWVPLITKLNEKNPAIKFSAEQAEWQSLGIEYLERAAVDRVFAFPLMFAIRSFDKKNIAAAAEATFAKTPAGKQQIIFISNHDIPRFAFGVDNNLDKQKIGATLNLLMGTLPCIYYGQEIGMTGKGEWGKWGFTDANEIPDREAFDWYKSNSGKGMATWYKDSGPWWDSAYNKPNDGISYEEAILDSSSLFNFYKKLTRLRKANEVFIYGNYTTVSNSNDSIYTFMRHTKNKSAIIAINLSGVKQNTTITIPPNKYGKGWKNIFNDAKVLLSHNRSYLTLAPYGIGIWTIE